MAGTRIPEAVAALTATGPDDGTGEVDSTVTTGNNGKDTGGKTIGKTYSGYVVHGRRAPTTEEGTGGGGKGQFSLVMFLLQLAMLAAAVSLVFVGYLVERRRQSDYRTVKK